MHGALSKRVEVSQLDASAQCGRPKSVATMPPTDAAAFLRGEVTELAA